MRRLARCLLVALLLVAVAGAAVGQQKDELRFAEGHVALPNEIEARADQLTELGPGLWESSRAITPRLFLSVGVVNRAGEPRPFVPFRLAVRSKIGVDVLAFDCTPERGQNTDVVMRSHRVDFLCRAESPPRGTVPDVAALLHGITDRPELTGIQLSEVRRPPPPRHTQPGVPAAPSAAQMVRSEEVAGARMHGISGFESRLYATRSLQFQLLVVLALGYYSCARAVGNTQTAFLFWMLGTTYVGSLAVREGIGGGWEGLGRLLVLMFMLFGAVAIPMAFHFLFTFVSSDWETKKRRIIHGLLLLGAAAVMFALEQLGV